MKKICTVLLGAVLLLCTAPLLAQPACAGQQIVSVTDYGANGGDTADDTAAFQKAFDLAKSGASTLTVVIPKGSYYLGSHPGGARAVWVYSNTTIQMEEGAVLLREKATPAQYLLEADGQRNITITGGTMDGNVEDTAQARGLMSLRSVDNVTITNVAFRNFCGTHAVLIDGGMGVYVGGCSFSGFIPFTGTAAAYRQQTNSTSYWSAEALHIDFIAPEGSGGGRSMRDVVVTGCTFDGVPSGVGTHHVYPALTAENIQIYGNTFRNCYYHGCNASNFRDFAFYDNQAVDTPTLLYAENTVGQVCRNRLDNSALRISKTGIYAFGSNRMNPDAFSAIEARNAGSDTDTNPTRLEIWDNELLLGNYTGEAVNTAKFCGIHTLYQASVDAHHNYITRSPYRGIYVDGGRSAVHDNAVTDSLICVYVANSTGSSVTGNRLIGSGDRGINVFCCQDTAVNDNYVSGVDKSGGAGRGIVLQESAGANTVDGNTVLDTEDVGIYLAGSGAESVSGNTIVRSGSSAIALNECRSASDKDVYLGADVTAVRGNVFYGNSGADLYLTGADTPSAVTEYSGSTSDKGSVRVNAGCAIASPEEAEVVEYGFAPTGEGMTPFTCLEPGYTRFTCANTGLSYDETDTGGVRAHSYDSAVTQPDASGEGFTRHTCTVCGRSCCDGYRPKTVPTVSVPEPITPANVSGYQVTAANANSVKFTWNKVPGAEGYIVYLYDKGGKGWKRYADTASNVQLVSKLNPGEAYSVTVRAYVNSGGRQVLSPGYTGFKVTTTLANVSGYKLSAVSANSVKFTWNKVKNAQGYIVYFYNKSRKSWTRLAKTTATTQLVSKLNPGEAYSVTVRAYRTIDGKEVLSSGYTAFKVSTNPAQVKFTLTSGAKGRVTVKWTRVTGATSYGIYYKASAKAGWRKIATAKSTASSYTKTGLRSGTGYFTVRAFRTYEKHTYGGAYAAKSVKIK